MTNWKELSHGNFSEAYGSMPVPKETKQRNKRRRLRRILMFGAILVAAGMAVAFFYRSELRGRYRQAMADYNLDRARTAMLAGDWNTAQNHARSVLIARANDPEAGRIRFTALRVLDHPQQVQAAYALFMNPQGNEALLPDALDIALEKGPQALFLRAYASLDEEMRRSNRVRAVLARFLNRRGEFAAALACVRDPEAPEEKSPALRVEECRALVGSKGIEAYPEVRTILAVLIEASLPPKFHPRPETDLAPARQTDQDEEGVTAPLDDPLKRAAEVEAAASGEEAARLARRDAGDAALEIMSMLARFTGGLADKETLPDLSDWVATQPQATVEHRLLALHQRMQLKPDDAEAILELAVKDQVGNDPAAVGKWMQTHGKHEQAVFVLLAPSKENFDAWVALVGNLLKLPDLERTRRIVDAPPPGHDPVIAACLDVLVRRAEQDERGERRAWRNAMEAARRDNDKNRFIEVATYASTVGAEIPALDAWSAAIRRGDGPLPLYRDIEAVVAALMRHGRTRDIHDITTIMSSLQPDDAALRNNALYLMLLYDSTAIREIEAELDALIKANPELLEIRATHAFAALVDGRPDASLDRLNGIGDTPRVPVHIRLGIAATAHAIADRPEMARPLLEQVPWGAFLPREREVLFRILSAKAAKDLPLPDLSIFVKPVPAPDDEEAPETEPEPPAQRPQDPLGGLTPADPSTPAQPNR